MRINILGLVSSSALEGEETVTDTDSAGSRSSSDEIDA